MVDWDKLIAQNESATKMADALAIPNAGKMFDEAFREAKKNQRLVREAKAIAIDLKATIAAGDWRSDAGAKAKVDKLLAILGGEIGHVSASQLPGGDDVRIVSVCGGTSGTMLELSFVNGRFVDAQTVVVPAGSFSVSPEI